MNKRINSIILALVMVVNMLATAVPAYAAPSQTVALKVTSDKAEAHPGDTVNFSVSIGAVTLLGGLDFYLSIPDGFTIVDSSITIPEGLEDTLDSDGDIGAPKEKNGYLWNYSAQDTGYTGTEELTLVTFACTVDEECSKEAKDVTVEVDVIFDNEDLEEIPYTIEKATVTVEAKPISVTGVTVDETMSLKTGESKDLTVTVTPDGATNKSVTFAVTGDAATVNAEGKVTGVKAGTATITVTTVDGEFTDTCVVTVACAHANKTETAEQASDCKTQGWDAYSTCDACGQIFNAAGEEISAIPFRPLSTQHTGGTATCKTQAVCTVCGESYGEVNSNNHEGVAEWTITDTTHKHEYTCCGADVIAEAEHVYTGEEDMVCNVEGCGYDRSCKHEDPLTHHEAKRPECGVPGNVEYWECEECHAKFERNDKTSDVLTDVTIEALEHSFTKEDKKEAALKTAGDCVKEAVYIKSCEHCGLVDTDVNNTFLGEKDADNHADYGEEIHEVPAKIGVTGLMAHYVCKCGKYFIDIDHDTHVEKKAVELNDLIIPALDNVIIKIKKVDENNQPLVGATFTMTGTNDGAGGPYTAISGENGIATFEVDSDGCYTITEIAAPAGYQLDATPEYIDVVNGVAIVYGEGEGFEGGQKAYDNNAPFIFVNEQYKAEFYVTKTDGENPLAGAQFKLENTVAGRTGYTATSVADGKVTFTDVVDGEYILSETQAPDGYTKSDSVVYFKVENGEVKYSSDRNSYVAYSDSLSIVNTVIPTASFSFTKTDENEAPLAGAIFHLTKEGASEPAYEATSDAETGVVSFEGVVDGTYILSEYIAPEGYVKIDKTWKFMVDTSSEDRPVKLYDEETQSYIGYENTLFIENEPVPPATATIVVKKTDGEGNALAGAKFILENGDNEYEAESNENGLVTFANVVEGYYTLKEVDAPEGYVLNEETWNFNIREDGNVNGFSEAMPNGYEYNNEEPLVIKNEEEPEIEVIIPITKVVTKGGTASVPATDITFEIEEYVMEEEILPTAEGAITLEDLLVTNVLEDAVEGDNEGAIILKGTMSEFSEFELLGKQFKITEKNLGSDWNCDETVWIVGFELMNDNTFMAYPRILTENDESEVSEDSMPVVTFENTYTKNTSSGGGSSTPSTPSNPTPSTPVVKPTLNKEDHVAFMQGYTDGTFGPTKNMTRGEVATMFARLLTEKMDADKTYTNTFTDVPADMWCYNYIGYMQQFGIITGYPDGSFRPEAPITRSEFAAIACRFE